MSRQHAAPILLTKERSETIRLLPKTMDDGANQISESELQELIHAHPESLPCDEIDSLFANAISICRELNTPAGPIDNFLVTPTGLPILVECKLWRNPQARREVVGQILDYAKELSGWTSSDLQREARRRLDGFDDPLIQLVRAAGHDVDETTFNDSLSYNLRTGRFLLLIVGDGIREGVEAIAEYVQEYSGLHFTLGLVEMPIFETPFGDTLITPRIVAKTFLMTRNVVEVPEGYAIEDNFEAEDDELSEMAQDRISFWTDFVTGLHFDDPEQPMPNVTKQGYVFLSMPVEGGSCWITTFRSIGRKKVGLFLSFTRDRIGERVVRNVVEQWEDIKDELPDSATLYEDNKGRPIIEDSMEFRSLDEGRDRQLAIKWLQKHANDFVNVIRPRVKAAAERVVEK